MNNRHAYLILAHADLDLLQILVGMLDDERNDIFIHMDRKFGRFEASMLEVKRSSLFVLEDRVDVAWGHSSIIEAEMHLFARAVAEAPAGGYARYHLLSGSCLPIKSQDYIHRFCAEHQGEEFITLWTDEAHMEDAHLKMDYYHYGMRYEKGLPRVPSILIAKCRWIVAKLLYRLLGKRPFEGGIAKGSNWVSLTHSAVSLLLDKRDYICSRFAHTRNGDEIFVQSLVLASPLRDKIYRGGDRQADIRFLDWVPRTASPNVLTDEHWEAIRSSDKLFARKFSSKLSASLIERIREHIKQMP